MAFTRGEIVSHAQMCVEEGKNLQPGMHFRLGASHSVLLMSLRKGAPYNDRLEDDDRVLIYEGHDARRVPGGADPKSLDQPAYTPHGSTTQNGLFREAAQTYRSGRAPPEIVRVYEKIRSNVWTFRGHFRLIDAWTEPSGSRDVFKFRLESIVEPTTADRPPEVLSAHTRLISSSVMQEVYRRDAGRCTKCGSTDNIHFDHILPFSKGGTSLTAENIQLLCARHNLEKHDRIE